MRYLFSTTRKRHHLSRRSDPPDSERSVKLVVVLHGGLLLHEAARTFRATRRAHTRTHTHTHHARARIRANYKNILHDTSSWPRLVIYGRYNCLVVTVINGNAAVARRAREMRNNKAQILGCELRESPRDYGAHARTLFRSRPSIYPRGYRFILVIFNARLTSLLFPLAISFAVSFPPSICERSLFSLSLSFPFF